MIPFIVWGWFTKCVTVFNFRVIIIIIVEGHLKFTHYSFSTIQISDESHCNWHSADNFPPKYLLCAIAHYHFETKSHTVRAIDCSDDNMITTINYSDRRNCAQLSNNMIQFIVNLFLLPRHCCCFSGTTLKSWLLRLLHLDTKLNDLLVVIQSSMGKCEWVRKGNFH